MDRLLDKLASAAAVNQRVAAHIEQKADDLIAREEEVLRRSEQAFEPHHAALDQRMKELDRFEDALQIVENANPLPRTGDSEKQQVDKLLQDAVQGAVSPLINGSDAPHEPAK